MALLISALDTALGAIFTLLVARRWLATRRPQHLLWTFALFIWTLAVAAETASALRGEWDPTTYRVYYAFGALMVAAWLGAGSFYLVAPRRLAVGFVLCVLTLSIAGSALIFFWPIDPAQLTHTDVLGFVDVKVFPFIPVRILIVISNILGTLAFSGSALYSVWRFWRERKEPRSTLGVLLIGIGGLVAASAHALGVLGGLGLFRLSELIVLGLIFGGYLLSTRPLPVTASQPAQAAG